MVFKLKRELRYMALRKDGFTPYESRELSKIITTHAPWLVEMRRERRAELRKFMKQDGASRKKFEAKVKLEYQENGWTKKMKVVGAWRKVIDPWKWYRKRRQDYVGDHPNWKSPGSNTTPKRPSTPSSKDRQAIGRRIGMDTTRGSDEIRARGF